MFPLRLPTTFPPSHESSIVCCVLQFILGALGLLFLGLRFLSGFTVNLSLNEGDDGLGASGVLVLDGVGLITSREEVDGRETLDLNRGVVVGGGIDLGDDNVLAVLEMLSNLVPDGDQGLAVSY